MSDSAEGVQGIHHEVHQDLLHLHAVRNNLRKIWLESSLYRHPPTPRLTFGQCNDFSNHLIQTKRGFVRLAIFQKRANSGDNLAGASAVTNDPLERLASLL